jgi:hypothetical protein
MSNVLGTLVLKLTIIVVKCFPLKKFDYLCAIVDFTMTSKWSSLANFASTPTLEWWNTILSMDFRFP